MRRTMTGAALALAALLIGGGTDAAFAQQKNTKKMSADAKRGRYIVQIAGCNDCHTPGYPESGGKVDEKLWLTGSPLGWRGPWGTTYPPNLRLDAQKLSEADFVKLARSELRPPMPWFNLRDMSTKDVRAIYQYLRHMGPAGEPAPAYVPPDKEPTPPFVQFPAPPPAKK
jgi:predicted ribosomally synthesized peptide with SipW-like signal peptide